MLMAASGDIVFGAGDTFVVHMDREALNDRPLGLYDVTVEIVTFKPDREIAWSIQFRGRRLPYVYGYRLEPADGHTLVTSYHDWSAIEDKQRAAAFPLIPESALRATLGILARTVAPGKPRPVPAP